MARLDGKDPVRPLRMSYRHVTGRLALGEGGAATYESTLERDWLMVLDFEQSVSSVLVQPFTLSYRHDGKTCRYTPDVKVTFSDGTVVVYEVKPRETLRSDWKLLKPRFKAALRHCRRQGWQFQIVNERHIRTSFLSNAKFLRRFRDLAPNPIIERALLRSLVALGEPSAQALLVATYWADENRAFAIPYLWRLLANGKVAANLDEPLTMRSVIRRAD